MVPLNSCFLLPSAAFGQSWRSNVSIWSWETKRRLFWGQSPGRSCHSNSFPALESPSFCKVPANFMCFLCLCVILSSGTFHLSLPPSVNEGLSEPLRAEGKQGVKKKTKQGSDGKAELKSLLSHMVILLHQLSFPFALQHISICHLFLSFKCTLYWFDLVFGLISFSPPFPALVSRSDKRLIDCIPCSEPDIPIKGFKAEFLVCQSLHCIFCSCLCLSLFHWFFIYF